MLVACYLTLTIHYDSDCWILHTFILLLHNILMFYPLQESTYHLTFHMDDLNKLLSKVSIVSIVSSLINIIPFVFVVQIIVIYIVYWTFWGEMENLYHCLRGGLRNKGEKMQAKCSRGPLVAGCSIICNRTHSYFRE